MWCSMDFVTNGESCPIRSALMSPPPEIGATLAVLGGKWKILILWRLLARTCRFNELRRAIDGVSQHMLTVHLRELEDEGIVTRTVFAEVPPRVKYALSEHGKTLGLVMKTLAEWGQLHLARPDAHARGASDASSRPSARKPRPVRLTETAG